jgi:hypothetical protein
MHIMTARDQSKGSFSSISSSLAALFACCIFFCYETMHANIKFCFKLKGVGASARETYKMLGTVYENEVESHLRVVRYFKKIQNET